MLTKGLFLFRKRQREAVEYAIRPGGEDFRVVAVESNRRWEWGVNVRRSAAWAGATLITADGKHNMNISMPRTTVPMTIMPTEQVS